MITNDRQGRGPQRFQGNGKPFGQATRPIEKVYEKLTEDNYVSLAEKAIKCLIRNSKSKGDGKPIVVSTSAIRNILAMTADIYNDVLGEKEENLSKELNGRINYLKVRLIYEAGRDSSKTGNDVRDNVKKMFIITTGLLDHVDDIKGSKNQFILFSRYMEALVAFRKYLVEQDG